MIQANELRIGNWIYYLDRYVLVIPDIINAVSRIVHPSVMYRPIPLTPEILEKAGFERKFTMGSTKDYWDKDGLLYAEDELVMTKGLHWLQNFHYFRTGEELTINL